jgi:uncharacterized cupredoxin-like copper-binding protein
MTSRTHERFDQFQMQHRSEVGLKKRGTGMIRIAILLLTLALAGGAWANDDFGRKGDPKKVTRTISIGMADTMRYSPSELEIQRGETVKFVVRNHGKLEHEMVIGTLKDLKTHADMMKQHPGMKHDELFAIDVGPGRTKTVVWQFTRGGTFHFGCFEPGHFEAGMVGKILVVE